MTEKISGQGFKPLDTGSTRRAEKVESGRGSHAAETRGESSGETVNVERSELLLGRIEQALQATPIVDAGRVSAIKDAVASGAYEIDPAIVAAKILRLERELA